MNNLKINHLAVVVCTILSMLIPMGWYGIFADQWMSMNSLTEAMIKENESTSMYISALISGLIASYVLAWLWKRMNIQTVQDGLITAVVIGFGLVFLTAMVHNMFELRPYGLSWINGGQNLVWIVIAGAILGGWTKQS